MRAFATLIVLAGAFVAGPVGWAVEVDGPEGAVATHSSDADDDQYALPVRSFASVEPTVTLNGRIIRRAWRASADRSVSAIMADYRQILAEAGYSVVLDCAGHACGGFDFRFGADLLPPPDMAMDVSEFQQLTVGRENPANYVSVLISKVRDQIFVQIITAMPKDPGMALIAGAATADASPEGEAGQADNVAKRDGGAPTKDDAGKDAPVDLSDGSDAAADENADPKAIDLAAGDLSKARPKVEVETEPEVAVAEDVEAGPEASDADAKEPDPKADASDPKDADAPKDTGTNSDAAPSVDADAGSDATDIATDDGSAATADAPSGEKTAVPPKPEKGDGALSDLAVPSDGSDNKTEDTSPSLDTDGAATDDVKTADAAVAETYVGPKPRPDWIVRLGTGEVVGAPEETGAGEATATGATDETPAPVNDDPEPDATAGAADGEAGDPETKDASLFGQLTRYGHVVVDGLLFESGGSELSDSSSAALDKMAGVMAENPSLRFAIVGHSDNVGSLDVNIKISRRRAEAVRRALIRRGIASNRLVARGVGFLAPRRSNATEEGRAMNRRVELVLGEPVD